MFSRIYNILVDILGESKQGVYDKNIVQYQFNCPCCTDLNGGIPDGKYNLEVNFLLLKYNCWKCGDIENTKGNLSVLIKKYGSLQHYRDFKCELDQIIKSKLYNIDFGYAVQKIERETLKLPKTFTKISLKKCTNKKLIEYLNSRNITQDIIDRFNIGYTTWDEDDKSLRNRVIIPSYDSFGDLNYWVGRDFSGYQKKMKYKNCNSDKKDIIFQELLIDWYSDIVLCEGAIDCIYYNNAIALLGKDLQKDSLLYSELYKKSNARIILCLDNDTTISEIKKIYNRLNFGRLYGKIWYIRLDKFKDFGEIYENFGKKGIIKALKGAKQFTEKDLLWQ